MNFRIADTFTSSLARLTGDEQKATKTTAFDLQMNPDRPGMKFHRLDKSKDKNFWSVRVSSDIRLIVHQSQDSLLLCYVDHHDKAYSWAERRKLETHPKTGAAQLVEIRERVQEIVVPAYVPAPVAVAAPKVLFTHLSDEELLGYGVPQEWLEDVKTATEESLLMLADHLPGEAAEALLELATGGKPQLRQPAEATANPFEHPDAQRRFRVMDSVEELERALEYPWDKWMVFLHPAQREWVERSYSGPARVAGSAGTGKTIVALHRAVFLARQHPEARVLLTTLSDVLANALQANLRRLISNEPRLGERIEVHSINAIGNRLYKAHFGAPQLAGNALLKEAMQKASQEVPDHKFSLAFLMTEWEQVVDAWQLETWEAYRDVARLGRKTRLPEQSRAVLWSIFKRVRDDLKSRDVMTQSGIFGRLTAALAESGHPPFDFIVVDEAQDISIAHLRFFAAIGGKRRDALFFAGDQGQRILQQPFSWYSLGVDIRGRSRTLRVNYRTSHQIRMQADLLLSPEVSDVDGVVEDRSNTISVFNGRVPQIKSFDSEEDEITCVAEWLRHQISAGASPHECAVFVRSDNEMSRATKAVKQAGLIPLVLNENMDTTNAHVVVSTMHLAKGLEFRAVVVMACDDEVIPSQRRIETVGDEADLQDVYETERHLLYVACTRARDELLVTSINPASEFLDDLQM